MQASGADENLFLTTQLEKNPFAGGRLGAGLYLWMVRLLYIGAACFSAAYLMVWAPFPTPPVPPWFYGLVWFVVLIAILVAWYAWLRHRGVFAAAE